jgi:hypothetical protein
VPSRKKEKAIPHGLKPISRPFVNVGAKVPTSGAKHLLREEN